MARLLERSLSGENMPQMPPTLMPWSPRIFLVSGDLIAQVRAVMVAVEFNEIRCRIFSSRAAESASGSMPKPQLLQDRFSRVFSFSGCFFFNSKKGLPDLFGFDFVVLFFHIGFDVLVRIYLSLRENGPPIWLPGFEGEIEIRHDVLADVIRRADLLVHEQDIARIRPQPRRRGNGSAAAASNSTRSPAPAPVVRLAQLQSYLVELKSKASARSIRVSGTFIVSGIAVPVRPANVQRRIDRPASGAVPGKMVAIFGQIKGPAKFLHVGVATGPVQAIGEFAVGILGLKFANDLRIGPANDVSGQLL